MTASNIFEAVIYLLHTKFFQISREVNKLRRMRTSRKGKHRFAIRSGAKESQATLSSFIGNSSEFPTKQNAPQDAHLAERKSSLRDPLGRERVASDSLLKFDPEKECRKSRDKIFPM